MFALLIALGAPPPLVMGVVNEARAFERGLEAERTRWASRRFACTEEPAAWIRGEMLPKMQRLTRLIERIDAALAAAPTERPRLLLASGRALDAFAELVCTVDRPVAAWLAACRKGAEPPTSNCEDVRPLKARAAAMFREGLEASGGADTPVARALAERVKASASGGR